MLFSVAFMIGLMGSLHCMGMCGPISMALPVPNRTPVRVLQAAILYNISRTLVYMLLGAIIGLLGVSISFAAPQQNLSVAMGLLMLLFVIMPKAWTMAMEKRVGSQWAAKLKKGFGYFFRKRSLWSFAGVGLLNGLLPCGLVYLALAGALAIGDWQKSALYMGAFGLGTFPMMLSVNLLGNWIKGKSFYRNFYRLVPVFTLLIALMFILRGLNLGIPYLSPQLRTAAGTQVVQCD